MRRVVAQAPAGAAPASQHAADAAEVPAPQEPLPHMALTRELMFRILGAEIAFQRGEWQSAYITLLGLAQQTRDPRLARRAAEFAHLARQQAEVLTAVRLWRELAPHSDEANQYFLGFVIMGDHLEEARPVLEQRLKDAPAQMRGALAFQFQQHLARARDKAAAFKLLDQVLAPYVAIPEVRLAIAQAAVTNGDLDRARNEARQALAAKPDSELAILSLAQATPDKADATSLLEGFLKRQPQSREVRLARARLLVEQQQYQTARAEFDRLLRDNPQDLTALYALGVLGVQTGDLAGAERHLHAYLEVLEQNPDAERDPSQAVLLLAQIAEERKDTDAMLKWLSRIEGGEVYVSAQIRRAQLLAKGGDVEQARSLLRQVNPASERDDAMLIMAEGQLLRDAGRLDEALKVYETGLARLPDNTDLLYDHAMLAEKRGQWDLMETSLRKIIEISPQHQHAYNALGYSLADRNIRLQEAFELISKALALAPDDAFTIDSMGWVQYRLGRLDEAEKLLRRAYSLRQDAEIATHLGEVLWVRGQREAALQLWREAQAKDPQNDTLKSTLARLNAEL
ncbi:MAG TPA: tetratricopeptide repeat protein [Noviherbaspirillum sp.]|nr:tetratricopeptide repeat protein [Noviherbaspirillum sp.]